MQTALAVASLTPAAACTGCYLGHRRAAEAATGTAMVLMLLAMVDTMVLGGRLLPAPVWGVVLAAVAVAVLVHRARRRRDVDPALHLAAMAVLLLVPAVGGSAGHHHGHGPGPTGWVLFAVVAVAVAHTGRAWLQLLRTPDATTRVEVGTAAASVLAMAAMTVL